MTHHVAPCNFEIVFKHRREVYVLCFVCMLSSFDSLLIVPFVALLYYITLFDNVSHRSTHQSTNCYSNKIKLSNNVYSAVIFRFEKSPSELFPTQKPIVPV